MASDRQVCCRLPTCFSGRLYLNLLILRFVSSDRAADSVLPTVQIPLLLLGEMAIVLRHVGLFPVLQTGFPVFQVSGLPWSQGAILHAIGDALLLALFPPVDLVHPRMSRIDHARSRA